MKHRRFLFGLTILASIVFLLTDQGLAQAPKRGGTLRVSYGNEIANLDFHTAPGYEMMWVAMNVGCGLVNITPDGKFVGDAAESWQIVARRPASTRSSSRRTCSSTTAPRSTPPP